MEVEFALEDKSVEFVRVGTVEWVKFLEYGFGAGLICFYSLISLGKCCSVSIGISGNWSLVRSIIIHRIEVC